MNITPQDLYIILAAGFISGSAATIVTSSLLTYLTTPRRHTRQRRIRQ